MRFILYCLPKVIVCCRGIVKLTREFYQFFYVWAYIIDILQVNFLIKFNLKKQQWNTALIVMK